MINRWDHLLPGRWRPEAGPMPLVSPARVEANEAGAL
jgi:hypothetical protein